MKFESKYQVLASIVIGGFTGLHLGATLSFSGIFLPQLPFTTSEKSWIASISNIGQLIGALISGFVSNSIGRNNCLLLFNISLLAGWLTLVFYQENVYLAILGRVLQGFGVMPSIGQVYLMEVLDTKHREVFGATLAVSLNIGITLVYALGALTNSWVAVAWIFAGLVILQCLGLIFIPKSPQWLICKGRTDEAKQSLKMLRGPNANIAKEIELLKNAAKLNEEINLSEANNNGEINLSEANNNGSTNSWREFLEPEVYKPLSLLILVFILQQLSGPFAVVSYAVTIFKRILQGDSAPKLASISVGVIRIVGSVLAVVLLKKKFSKRLQMTTSAIGMFLAMVCLAAVEYVKQNPETETSNEENQKLDGSKSTTVSVITVISSSAFLLFHAIGFNVIPMILMGELCPPKLKSLTSGIVMSMVAILVFGVVKIFPLALDVVGGPGTYGFFAAFCVGAALFGFFLIPETRGKNVEELSFLYRGRAITVNPTDIIASSMNLPGSRKSSELGGAPPRGLSLNTIKIN